MSPLIHLRHPTPSDIPSLLLLERLSDTPDNWTTRDFTTLISTHPHPTFPIFYIPPSIAYLSYHLTPTACHLLSLTVHPLHRRQHLASSLLASCLPTHLPILCHVRESNLPAQLFLAYNSFHCTHISPRHFTSPPEPSYVFTRRPF